VRRTSPRSSYLCRVPTRLAVFSVVESSIGTVRDWAARAGHEIAIVVTMPGTAAAPGLSKSIVGNRDNVVMVVPTVEACEAALADLDVDLGVVFSFSRVPESVASLPRHGMVNVHLSMLPAYRGANGFRAIYEGEPQIGATLHYLTPEFDAGPILAQASEPTPEDVQPASALDALQRAAGAVLEAGVPRALAGERGEDQDAASASTAPRFTEEEAILDLGLSTHLFQCRTSALVLAGIQPWVVLDGDRRPLRAARALRGLTADAPGVVTLSSRRAIVSAANGVLELELGELPF
jgi:methionyl-tRNA formyltransferase